MKSLRAGLLVYKAGSGSRIHVYVCILYYMACARALSSLTIQGRFRETFSLRRGAPLCCSTVWGGEGDKTRTLMKGMADLFSFHLCSCGHYLVSLGYV